MHLNVYFLSFHRRFYLYSIYAQHILLVYVFLGNKQTNLGAVCSLAGCNSGRIMDSSNKVYRRSIKWQRLVNTCRHLLDVVNVIFKSFFCLALICCI